MSAGIIVLIVILAIVAVVILFIWSTYNGLVTLRQRVREAWSGIDVQLKRRASLVPNLVETVKGYAAHEKTVFENVTKARSALMSATTPQQAAQADNMLTGALKTLFAVSEAYPDLKANQNFLQLQGELSDLEAKIAYARQFYNTNVRDFNTRVQVFPAVLIARNFGFKEEGYFEAEEAARADVKVSFSN
ncbi:MAG: LemA family protein [SAR202 cluster bacterium]|nr:LemA family protein [SAR202 cluster bacterium]